ncbi:MAG: single-stranded DNA-binding protein [Actinomyces ruminicola]|uniref:Single-stranded DNA-binding protein n=1 Tax=Actinomyces ruminicola TaxID=332524 RepID=A0A1G9ZK77_9ACTO|nr:single-stranded DNA-binding protein [Actinomyces ruminicola]MBE6480975.1 single-stranded DNA-binding protein [Actinomyces ruminicola]SDN21882.1 single stranded DNA-binding protein (ssb) [Actinomyces ruminicola]
MSRQLDLVVQGVLGTNPAVTRTTGGRAYCYFRLATSPSFRTAEGWRDGQTIWFTAKAWGALAENLGRSLHKGDPVVLVGRFTQESWSKGSDEYLTNVLNVSCGGHDLTRGESRFMRIIHKADPADNGDAGAPDAAATTSSGSAQTAGSAPSPDEPRQSSSDQCLPPATAPLDTTPAAEPFADHSTSPQHQEELRDPRGDEPASEPQAVDGQFDTDYLLADEED